MENIPTDAEAGKEDGLRNKRQTASHKSNQTCHLGRTSCPEPPGTDRRETIKDHLDHQDGKSVRQVPSELKMGQSSDKKRRPTTPLSQSR